MSSSGEKTEEATSRKIQDAQKEGNFAKSPDAVSALVLFAVCVSLMLGMQSIYATLKDLFIAIYTAIGDPARQLPAMIVLAEQALGSIVLPILGLACVMAIAGMALQVGFSIDGARVAMKLDKLDPINGAKNLFKLRKLFELAKSVLGLFVIGAAVAVLFYSHLRDFVKIPASGMHGVLTVGASVFLKLMSFVIPLFFAMAAVDYLFKRFIWAQDLRMTKDEVKRERKGQNGNPMMKSQLRKIGREMQEADNLEQFDFATLVLHDDGGQMVAIYFNPEQSPLPWVLCKSQGAMTEELLAHAAQKGMRMQHDDVLTRILFSRCRVNQFIPEEVADELGSMLR